MTVEIGSQYEENKRRLIDKIRLGKITGIRVQAEDQRCYFCLGKIEE